MVDGMGTIINQHDWGLDLNRNTFNVQTSLKSLQGDEEVMECWDDDDDLQCNDDIQFRTVSTATSVTGSSVRPSGHRDSISSRRSCRSDLDSNVGDEEWQLLLNDNDESATQEAIASAKNAGIPLPANIPRSALLGGTIKRLGGRKIKKAMGDDWSEDLELSDVDGELELKLSERAGSPDSLRQLGIFTTISPIKGRDLDPFTDVNVSPPSKSAIANLDKFGDMVDDPSFHDVPTIKIAKSLAPQNPILFHPSPTKPGKQDESFEDDLELPADGKPLKLATRQDIPRTPDPPGEDFDAEWAEGSIGVRFGGTRRDGRSNRSSSISALSPSVSSCLTAESEDEGLDGLVLPDGPLDLKNPLKRRQEALLSEASGCTGQNHKRASPSKEDFFSGIEIGDGQLFDSGKLRLNRNIKHKRVRPSSPPRRTATTITFTNKPMPTSTRIPRLSGHERPHSTHLEPVSESGAPVPKFRRPHSRLGGHSPHSSLPSIPLPSPPSASSSVSIPARRALCSRVSREALRSEPTTTSAQLLKARRSVPAMRSGLQSGTTAPAGRPPSRQDGSSRPSSSSRPKTPIDRSTTESRFMANRRVQMPFLPAGISHNQSHHASLKAARQLRSADSDNSGDVFVTPRSMSRLSNLNRPETPGRIRADLAPESLTAVARHAVTKPARRRNFGDGTELDAFDDLPTSASAESKFVKPPLRRGAPRLLRSKLSQTQTASPSRTDTPVPASLPQSPPRQEYTPRFARDTNASRNAREQRIASMTLNPKDRESGPLVPLSTNWKTHGTTRGLASPSAVRSKRGKGTTDAVNKPHLIKPMGTGVHEARSVKGMQYNPALYKWEGNQNAIAAFDAPPSPKSPKPAPALITNVGTMQGVQVVGGMVFDPQRMCWLKMGPSQASKNGVAVAPDEEDVFAGLGDLEDRPSKATAGGKANRPLSDAGGADSATYVDDRSGGESSDEWPITEEFDVGPEFIKRQRSEEEKWKRKVNSWVRGDRKTLGDGWKWAIRDLVTSDLSNDAQ